MIVIKDYFRYMKPIGRINPVSLPETHNFNGRVIFKWVDPEDQCMFLFDTKTNELNGTYYEWSDEDQDWVTSEVIEDDELLCRLKDKQFILV